MQDTRPASTPAALLPDEDAWRRLAGCLERRAQSLRDPQDVARQAFQRAEILAGELRDDEGAQVAYEAALDAWPAHLPALLALRDMAISRDDPALAAAIFDRVETLLRGELEARDRAELSQSFLLLWVFRWRDTARAGRAADWVETTDGGPELLALLEPLLSDAQHRRARLETRAARLGDAESQRRLGCLLADELADPAAGFDWLAQAADEDAAARWRLLEAAVARADYAAAADHLEAMTAFVPQTVAAALRFLAAEICELRLGDALRADLLYGQSRGGTLHAVVGLKRVLSAVSEGPQALLRRLSEESEQLGEVGLDRVFAVRAMHLAAQRGDDATTERVARSVLARYPEEEEAAELVERLCYQTRRWPALAEAWERHRTADATLTGERPAIDPGTPRAPVSPQAPVAPQATDRALRLASSALHEHARFDPDAALVALPRRGAVGHRVERDATVLRTMQRLTVRASAPERVRAWQFEADVSESPERRADLFLKIGRTLLRHTNEHEKALTYLFWVLDQQPENLTALRLIEGVCRARGSYKPLAEILARELPLFDRPEERFPLARELGALHETQEGDPERAITRFEQALADQPGDAATARDLMRLYAATDRMSDLRALLGDRLRLKLPPGERTEILLRLGELAEQHFRDPQTARQHYDQAMTTARLPGVPPATRRSVEAALTRLHAAAAPPPEPVPVPPAPPAAPRLSTLEALDARELFEDMDALGSISSAALDAEDLLDDPDSATSGGEPEPEPETGAAFVEATRVESAPGGRITPRPHMAPGSLPALPRLPTPAPRTSTTDAPARPLPQPSAALRATAGPAAGSMPPLPKLPPRNTPAPTVATGGVRGASFEATIAAQARRPDAEAEADVDASVDAPATGPLDPSAWQLGEESARPAEADPGRAVIARKLKKGRPESPNAPGVSAPEDPWPDFGDPGAARAVAALVLAADADAKAVAAASLAEHYERLSQIAGAVRAWRTVLAWRAGDRAAEDRLAALYPKIADHAALAELRARQAERTGDAERRAALRLEALHLHLGPLADPVGAMPQFRELLAEARLPVDTGEALAGALGAAGAFEARQEVLSALQTVSPTPARGAELGRLLLHRLNRPDEALVHLEAAARVLPEAQADLAVCRAARGETELALRMLAEGALELSGRPSVKLHLARLLERQGAEPDRVRRLYLDALEAGERDPEFLDTLEQIAVGQKDWPLLARIVATQLAAAPPDRTDEIRDLAVRLGHLYYKRLDQPLDAAAAFLRAWRLQPSDLSLYRVIEGILARTPSPSLQIELYSAFLDLARTTGRERVATTLKLAGLLEQAGRVDEACARLEVLPTAPEVTATLERLYPQAERWSALADLLRARLEHHPDNPAPVLRRLAQTLETGLRDLPGATDAWRAVLEAEPEDLPTVRALCRLLEAQKRWPELVEMSEREYGLCTDRRQQAYILFRMGSLQETQLGQAEAATRNYKRALEHDPRCFPALHGLRELAAAAGQWVTVIQYLAREVDLWEEPRERASVLARIGEIHETHLNDPDEALGQYRRAVGIYPACLPALRALADDAVRREAWEEAAPYFQVLSNQNLDKWPRAQRAEVFARRGLVALRLGRTIEATECLKITLELNPDHLDALSLLVEAHAHARNEAARDELMGRLSAVEAAAVKAADTVRQARVVCLRGRVLADEFAFEAAEACFAEAARLCPLDLALLRPLVELYLANRRWAEATRALRVYTDRGPTGGAHAHGPDPQIEALLWEGDIWCDFAVDPGRALECYRRVLALDDSHPPALFRMAQCQYLQGRYADARESMALLLAVADDTRAPASARAEYRFYMGRIHQIGLQAPEAALAHYRAALELDPRCAAASLALLRLWESQGDRASVDRHLAEHPEILTLPETPVRAAGLLLAYIARIRQDRGDRVGAKAVLTSLTAREGPTTRDARFALVRLSQGQANPAEATEQLTRILDRDICDIEALRALGELVQRHGDEERLYPVLSTLELLKALTPEEETRFVALRDRARKALERGVRPVPDALLAAHLHHPAFESPIVSVIGPLDPALARQFGARVLPGRVRKADKLVSAAELKLIQSLCGYKTFDLLQTPDIAEAVALIPGERPTVLLGEGTVGAELGPLHRRFAVTRAVALARYGLARVHDIDTERAVELLRVLEGLFTPSADGSERERERELLDAVPKRVADQLRPELERRRQGTLPALYTGESALIGVMRTADRFGFLACGELRPCVEHLARSGGALEVPAGGDLTWAIRGRSRLQDLVKYALSEDHHLLRRAIGLAV